MTYVTSLNLMISFVLTGYVFIIDLLFFFYVIYFIQLTSFAVSHKHVSLKILFPKHPRLEKELHVLDHWQSSHGMYAVKK